VSEPDAGLSKEHVAAKWREIAAGVDRVQKRVEKPAAFSVSAGSSLFGDDRASDPYQVSHAVQLCLLGGIDHLHAAKSLLLDAQMLHTFALYTLLRASLETFTAAFWILHPPNRNLRIERTLRWHAKNFMDQDIAIGVRDIPGNRPLKEKLAKLEKVAESRSIAPGVVSAGYRSSNAVKYADEHAIAGPLLSWQLCSGYAHGRMWAVLGLSEQQFYPADDPKVRSMRLTSDPGRVLFPAHTAFLLMEEIERLLDQRS
jgi:hypothetical protein